MCFSWWGNFSSKDISVFLCDDNPLFLENLAFLLNQQKGIIVVGKTTSLEEARQFTKKNPPQIAILGIGMFNKEGILYSSFSLARGRDTSYRFSFR